MKNILVPTDFSKAARNAANYATVFAKAIKANVILLHVYHIPAPPSLDGSYLEPIPFEEIREEIEKRLKKESDRLKKKTGEHVKYAAKMGLAVDGILEEEKKASYIVMGMKGTNSASEILMGSVTTTVLRKAKTPVLVIPEKAIYKKPGKIVYTCDYNSLSDFKTIDLLKSIQKDFNANLFVLNVKGKQESASIPVKIGKSIESKLSNVKHQFVYSENEDVVTGVNEFVKNSKADIVTVVPHQHNMIERLFHSSISKRMAFHTRVPLLALPADKKKN
jgi:nucleotide-binding universal stress UspA family protein